MKKLQHVSIAGPDNQTSIEELAQVSDAFPFVEWGVLYSATSAGNARYPSLPWCEEFFGTAMKGYKAVHLCGVAAFVQLLSDDLPDYVYRADRLQLNLNARRFTNGNSDLIRIYEKALSLAPTVILQYHEGTDEAIDAWLAVLTPPERNRVHVLIDGSGGKGVAIPADKLVRPVSAQEHLVGFAGGLTPDNVVHILKKALHHQQEFWLDLESGARVNDEFDLGKVKSILSACAEYVVPQSGSNTLTP